MQSLNKLKLKIKELGWLKDGNIIGVVVVLLFFGVSFLSSLNKGIGDKQIFQKAKTLIEEGYYVDSTECPDLDMVKKLVELGRSINIERAAEERKEFIDNISKTQDKKTLLYLGELSRKVASSPEASSEQRENESAFYNAMIKLAKNIDDYPNFKMYTEYVNIYASINWDKVLTQIKKIKKNQF